MVTIVFVAKCCMIDLGVEDVFASVSRRGAERIEEGQKRTTRLASDMMLAEVVGHRSMLRVSTVMKVETVSVFVGGYVVVIVQADDLMPF